MKVSMVQLNATVGDIRGNLKKFKAAVEHVAPEKPDLVISQELFLSGYPPRDLLERQAFIDRVQGAIRDLLQFSLRYKNTGLLIGAPLPTGRNQGKGLFNSALLIYRGEILAQVNKSLLPTYDVFDEARYFDPSSSSELHPVPFKGERLGITICEDAWNDPELWYRPIYWFDPVARLAEMGATVMVNLSASPFNLGKDAVRYRLVHNHASKHGVPFVLVNQIGGNDELIFDGTSLAVDARGRLLAQLPSFQEAIATVELEGGRVHQEFHPMERIQSAHDALIMGLRDYVRKCGFRSAVLGLSGGIDSAVVAALAARALGPENVLGITMPSEFSSRGSVEDSRQLAKNLGIQFKIVPIREIYHSYLRELAAHFEGREFDVTEENIQARIRGDLVMAFSNKFGHLALSTGNKSELAMGYCTLYGDMTGGLAVISDVPKTMVYRLARYMNREGEIIPEAILRKVPSAELRPGQTDQDTLPPYDVLDEILDLYLMKELPASEIVARGFDPQMVAQVVRTVDRNEYKRRQAPPGLRITSKAFGTGRRMPIAARYEESWGLQP